MTDLHWFEKITRRAFAVDESMPEESVELHPFETRNIHPDLPAKVKKLYDDGYYPESTFEAFKFVEKEVKRISALRGLTGNKLMMAALNEQAPVIYVNGMASGSDKD